MPGGGDFVSFFSTRGPEFCTEKLSPGRGILTEKISGRESARGVVTGQIDTCITKHQTSNQKQQRALFTHKSLCLDSVLLLALQVQPYFRII